MILTEAAPSQGRVRLRLKEECFSEAIRAKEV